MALKSKLINITNTLFIILFFSSCADIGGLVEIAVKENKINSLVFCTSDKCPKEI